MDLKIKKTHEGLRLDQYLVDVLDLSRSKLQLQIKKGYITVNQKSIKASYLLQEHDVVSVLNEPEKKSSKLLVDHVDFLYEDESILVINKPIGLSVHSDQSNQDTLVDYLVRNNISLAATSSQRPGIVHRLDKMTEGVMVVAKTIHAFNHLKEQFKSRTVIKKYYAMVSGNLPNDFYDINRPIARHPSKRHIFKVDPAGKEAITLVQVLKRYNTKTLCDVAIKTGRTHQIRVHLSAIGFPLINDVEYAKAKNKKGQLLQAYFLSFFHPLSKLRFTFEIPLGNRLK